MNLETYKIRFGDLPDEEEFTWETAVGYSWVKKAGKDPVTGREVLWQHRVDGPAIIWNNGCVAWWVDGNRIRTYSEFQALTGCSDEDILLYRLKYGSM